MAESGEKKPSPSIDSVHAEFSAVKSELSKGWSERTGGRARQPRMRKARVLKPKRTKPYKGQSSTHAEAKREAKPAAQGIATSLIKSLFKSASKIDSDSLNAFYFGGGKRRRKS